MKALLLYNVSSPDVKITAWCMCSIMTVNGKSRWMWQGPVLQMNWKEWQRLQLSCILNIWISSLGCCDWGSCDSLQALHTDAGKMEQGCYLSDIALYPNQVSFCRNILCCCNILKWASKQQSAVFVQQCVCQWTQNIIMSPPIHSLLGEKMITLQCGYSHSWQKCK
jgi:hypothetical protein